MHDATYRALGRRAAAQPGPVVVDATFHRRDLRDAFRAQLGTAEPRSYWVECLAPVEVLERRLRAREQEPGRVSDATLAVLHRQLARREPLDEVPAARHLQVRSDQPLEAVLDSIEDALDRRAA
jgi:predicted kinase